METVLRIKRHLDSETLYLPELRDLIGQDVEITVSTGIDEEAIDDAEYAPLRGSVLRYDDPFEPGEEHWEAGE
ncbi:MAG TPA: hypothetical protein PJ994_08745 [Tepidiformaceae bacterium]|nr:hypothetical protein [Tepidiformaceae bacterium]